MCTTVSLSTAVKLDCSQSISPGFAFAVALLDTLPPSVDTLGPVLTVTLSVARLTPVPRFAATIWRASIAPTKLLQLFGSFGVSLHVIEWATGSAGPVAR